MYPEHEKLAKIKDQSQAIGEFLEWLGDKKDIILGQFYYEEFSPAHTSMLTLLAEFFDINQDILEQEKRAMIEDLRNQR